jgi:phosphoribosylformimino-5-aminoimidazole carboxamide ribotide isomerase
MFEIIPAIDLIDGKCVRLAQGDFARKKIYDENPVEVAKTFEGFGIKRLHVVDLDGAKRGKLANVHILREIARDTDLTIDFGGGIKTDDDIQAVFEAGAGLANIGSTAVREPDKFLAWINEYGGEKILLGADVKDEKIAVNGWQTKTDLQIVPFLRTYRAKGVTQAFVTDIAKDGVLQGPSVELYRGILNALPGLKLIASGGVSSISDIEELEQIGCSGAIIGKAIYEGLINLGELIRRKYHAG